MAEEKSSELGCCGYDEIERKPQTTSPLYGLKAKPIGLSEPKKDPMRTRRISFMGSNVYPVRNFGKV